MFQLIDQTDDFIIIDKAPGISVHKDQNEAGLVMLLKQQLSLPELHPVHRLDKVTSGLMLLAKHSAAAAALAEQFRLHRVEKFYLALSDTKPKRKQGTVIGDMAKARRGGFKLLKSRNNPAITQFFSCSLLPGIRLFLVRPVSGKTHQIRVALKSEGAAILGDPVYHAATEGSDRTYLHAYSLSFTYNGQGYSYRCLPTIGRLFNEQCRQLIEEKYTDPRGLTWPKLAIKQD